MKKSFLVSILILLLLICVFIVLYYTRGAKKDSVVQVSFSSWGSESEVAIIKPILREFETKNPGIKVNFIHIPKNYFQKIQLLIASNLAPDVIFINNFYGPLYVEGDILYDLDYFLKKDDSIMLNTYYKQAISALTYKKHLYALPRDISNLVIYYNKDIFDKYKISYPDKNWTFKDFLKTVKLLTKDFNHDGRIDQFGIGFEKQPLFWMPFLWSNGGGIISSDLKTVLINKPESVESIQFYSDLRNKHHVAPTASEAGSATMSQLFMQQRIAMQINGRWAVPRYRKDIVFNWDIARFPRGKRGSVVDADTSGWAISKTTKHPMESWKLVKFLAGKAAIQKFTESGLIVPARHDVANSKIFLNSTKSPANSRLFLDIIPESIPTPANQNYQEITDLVTSAIEPVLNGDLSAKQAITPDFTRKIVKLLQ